MIKIFPFLRCCLLASLLFMAADAAAVSKIYVKPPKGDATATLRKALEKASRSDGPVEIILSPGVYHLYHDKATVRPYRLSNTASADEHPTADKHIGVLIKGIKDLTVRADGQATLMTHGEMTAWAIDSCRNVSLQGLKIDASDPTVTEMTVVERDDSVIIARPHKDSRYEIRDGRLWWIGEGWAFTDGIAQIYSPKNGTTLRCASPVADAAMAEEATPGTLRLRFRGNAPACTPGDVFQMRHSIRNEVGAFINRSENVTLSDIHLAFIGNFGLLSQMSADLTFERMLCAPDSTSGRTVASYADFLHFSGCRGKIRISDSEFSSTHDDDINVHGTHQLIERTDGNKIYVRYKHPQTFGFLGFTPGDTIAITDASTLIPGRQVTVTEARMIDPYVTELVLDSDIGADAEGKVAENRTWSPSVEIRNCMFSLTPTRGILLTTWRPITVTGCRFVKCPMPAILIADDGRSWYESGPVEDVTISDNTFVDCASPVISIKPENVPAEECVHSGIRITGNRFVSPTPVRIEVRSVNGLTVRDNSCVNPSGARVDFTVDVTDCENVTIENR